MPAIIFMVRLPLLLDVTSDYFDLHVFQPYVGFQFGVRGRMQILTSSILADPIERILRLSPLLPDIEFDVSFLGQA